MGSEISPWSERSRWPVLDHSMQKLSKFKHGGTRNGALAKGALAKGALAKEALAKGSPVSYTHLTLPTILLV